jgi:hypothetical protein
MSTPKPGQIVNYSVKIGEKLVTRPAIVTNVVIAKCNDCSRTPRSDGSGNFDVKYFVRDEVRLDLTIFPRVADGLGANGVYGKLDVPAGKADAKGEYPSGTWHAIPEPDSSEADKAGAKDSKPEKADKKEKAPAKTDSSEADKAGAKDSKPEKADKKEKAPAKTDSSEGEKSAAK